MTDFVNSANAETRSVQARGDRDLLELAAKAAGMGRGQWDYDYVRGLGHMVTPQMMWNPLTNDGEALRLAVKLHMNVAVNFSNTVAEPIEGHSALVEHGIDPAAATRRAIVNAAAEVGKATS